MNKHVISSISAIIVLSVSAIAFAGLKAPTKTSGISAKTLHNNELSAQQPAFKGHELRGRKLTIMPGGGTVEHSHAKKPGIVYVISGAIVEVRNGVKRTFQAGDTWIKKGDTVHWGQNDTDRPAVIWVVDLPKQK